MKTMTKHCWLLLAILFANCTVPPVLSVSPRQSREAEEHAVYATLINQMYVRGQVEQIVIKDQTSLGGFGENDLDEIFQRVALKLPALQKATFSDLQARNRQSSRLDNYFNSGSMYVLLNEDEMNKLLHENTGGWISLYKRYPKSQGIMTLSRVGFNAEMNQALVYVGNQSGPKTGAGYYVLLARENGTWIIKDRYGAWLS